MTFDVEILPETFIRAGYRKQANGFVKNIGTDARFHARIKSKQIDIHFELWPQNRAGHPMVFHAPETIKEEIKRLRSYGRI